MSKFKIGDIIVIDCIKDQRVHGKMGKIKDIKFQSDDLNYPGSFFPYLIEPIGWETGYPENEAWATEEVLRISNSSLVKEKLGIK